MRSNHGALSHVTWIYEQTYLSNIGFIKVYDVTVSTVKSRYKDTEIVPKD